MGGVDIRGSATGTRRDRHASTPATSRRRCTAFCWRAAAPSGWRRLRACGATWNIAASGFDTGAAKVPIVPAAILYDLGIGKADVRPTAAMGEAAAAAATDDAVAEGCGGRGHRRHGGQDPRHEAGHEIGRRIVHRDALPGGVLVSALVAVNALGRRARSGHRQDCGRRAQDAGRPRVRRHRRSR